MTYLYYNEVVLSIRGQHSDSVGVVMFMVWCGGTYNWNMKA